MRLNNRSDAEWQKWFALLKECGISGVMFEGDVYKRQDVDDEDVETQKVHNAVARVRFINEEIASRVQTKHYNCHEGCLLYTSRIFINTK